MTIEMDGHADDIVETSRKQPARRGGRAGRLSRLVQRAAEVVVTVEDVLLRLVVAAGKRAIESRDDLCGSQRVRRGASSGIQQGGHRMTTESVQPTSASAQHLEQRLPRECVVKVEVEQLTWLVRRRP